MTTSLVLELQHLATEADTDLAPLLRKALVIATKLKREDFRTWISFELNGYDKEEVPNYRKLRAEIRLKNPYRGLIPLHFEDQNLYDMLTLIQVRDPLPNLISVIKGHGPGRANPVYPLSQRQEALLLQQQEGGLGLPPIRTLSINQIEGVVEAARTAILEWTLRLESEGILGEGMTFTKEEKDKATQSPSIRIDNFQGILGNVTQSTVTQNLRQKISKGDFESLKSHLESNGIGEPELGELKEALLADGALNLKEGFGAKVSGWIGKMVTKAADGSWQVALGASANLLSDAIKAYYGV